VPQPHQYQFDAYQQHQYEDHHEQPVIEQEQHDIEQEQHDIEEAQQQDHIEQPQQHDGGVCFQGVPRVVYEAEPDGYAGGLLTSRFYLTLVDMWHGGYKSMLM